MWATPLLSPKPGLPRCCRPWVLPVRRPPEAQQGWVDHVLQAGAAATEAAEKAVNAAVRQPIVGGNGNWWTWDLEAGAYVDTGIYSGGDAPHIGTNGNWYVGQTDTGVPATGPAGPALAVTNTAAVGQTVKITAVDENGQPTEWEAVDMAGGSDQNTVQIVNISDEVVNEKFDFIIHGQGLYFSSNSIEFKFLHWDENQENYTTNTTYCSGLFIVSYESDNGWKVNNVSTGYIFTQFSDTPIVDGFYDEAYGFVAKAL